MRTVGVDVGTGTIVATERSKGEVVHHKIKDAFFKINPKDFMQGSAMSFGEKMLVKSGAHFIKVDGVLHILGDDATKFANLFHQECHRPMAKGVLNPMEPVSILMAQELIKGVGNKLPVIDGYGEGTFTLNAGFNLMAGIRLFRSLMEKDGGGFDYRFEAKLDPGAFKRKIRISDSGTIALSGT